MRPSAYFVLVILLVCLVLVTITIHHQIRLKAAMDAPHLYDRLSAELGLSDLCLSTEARYTRHPAVSDAVVPFMDYPASLEHFPSGLFWAPQ